VFGADRPAAGQYEGEDGVVDVVVVGRGLLESAVCGIFASREPSS
jgi:hypothetical protein